MVLTDGGAQRPTEMFEKYNHNKTVRAEFTRHGLVLDTNIHIHKLQ